MRKVFWASLCYAGAHGGGLYVTDDGVAFYTKKVQLPENIKSLKISYNDIENVRSGDSLLVFPSIIVTLKTGAEYKFIVFRKRTALRSISNNLI